MNSGMVELVPMKQTREFPSAVVTEKQKASIQNGHPWVYADEILSLSAETVVNGSLVDVLSRKGQYLGTGLYSEHSQIRIRILDANANEKYGEPFFARRVKYAVDYRYLVMKDQVSCCRLIHGEADGLPGLTVDCYNGILVAEVLSYGMELRKEWIYAALKRELAAHGMPVNGIYERNEGELRAKEGLEACQGWYGEDHPDSCLTVITENGIRYEVDVENGQKTGFFLDQKYNRLAVRNLAKGRKVLDCCTHTGSFALNAALGGAAAVTAVDISESAIAMAKKNAQLNGAAMNFVTADVFEYLPAQIEAHADYDFIILDPPAFTKSRRTYHNAREGYRKINAQAMRLLPRGGILATCSCSHFMPTEEFRSMLNEAGREAGVRIRVIEERHASPDHPVLLGVPETDYLKFFLVQVV